MVEGNAMPDHVHMVIRIPPKFSVSNTIGRLKGKSAILIHKRHLGRGKNLTGYHFWARGYCVSTVGLDEEMVLKYVREQEESDKGEDQYLLPFVK